MSKEVKIGYSVKYQYHPLDHKRTAPLDYTIDEVAYTIVWDDLGGRGSGLDLYYDAKTGKAIPSVRYDTRAEASEAARGYMKYTDFIVADMREMVEAIEKARGVI